MISENRHRGSLLISAVKEWLLARTETIDVLRNEADSIVSHRWTTAVLTIGTVGLGVATALAPFTFGTSVLVAAGVAAGGAAGAAAGLAVGGAAVVGTQAVISHYLEGRNYADSQQKIEKDRKLCNTVNERMESVSNFCEDICITFTAFDKHKAFELVLAGHTQVSQVEHLSWSDLPSSATQLHFDRRMLDYLLVDHLPDNLRALNADLLEVIGKTQTVIKLRRLADQLEEEQKRFERFGNLPYQTAPTAIEQASNH